MEKIDLGENSNKEDKTKQKIGFGITFDKATGQAIAETNKKFAKPDYNPQTRKKYYDDPSAHKRAMDKAFADGNPVRDPYTGAELVSKQRDAKSIYGENWQSHAAEADHKDPLSCFVDRNKKNPFTTTEDMKEIGNSEENYQVLSRKLNQGSKEIGKGGSTQSEWANDSKRMEGVGKNIESGDSLDEVKQKITNEGCIAEKNNDKKVAKRSAQNAANTFHETGIEVGKNAGITTATMSGIMNIVAVIKGDKTVEDALVDTAKDSGKAAASGYVMGGGLTVISQMLSYSSSEFVKTLIKNNVPGKVITAVIVTGDTLKKWGNGEITTQECLIQLGDKGLNAVTMGYSMVVGQALIPIPIVGGAVGALVGSLLTSNLYNGIINDLKTKQIEHEERVKIIAQCNEIARQAKEYRMQLEAIINSYFEEYRKCFNDALSSMQVSYRLGDADGVIASANEITYKLGGNIKYRTVDEFKEILNSDEDDIL